MDRSPVSRRTLGAGLVALAGAAALPVGGASAQASFSPLIHGYVWVTKITPQHTGELAGRFVVTFDWSSLYNPNPSVWQAINFTPPEPGSSPDVSIKPFGTGGLYDTFLLGEEIQGGVISRTANTICANVNETITGSTFRITPDRVWLQFIGFNGTASP